jgi:hypothetical protein
LATDFKKLRLKVEAEEEVPEPCPWLRLAREQLAKLKPDGSESSDSDSDELEGHNEFIGDHGEQAAAAAAAAIIVRTGTHGVRLITDSVGHCHVYRLARPSRRPALLASLPLANLTHWMTK